MHGRLLPHVPDPFHAFLQLGDSHPPLFDRQLDLVLLEPGLLESFFEGVYFLLQPEHRRIDFL